MRVAWIAPPPQKRRNKCRRRRRLQWRYRGGARAASFFFGGAGSAKQFRSRPPPRLPNAPMNQEGASKRWYLCRCIVVRPGEGRSDVFAGRLWPAMSPPLKKKREISRGRVAHRPRAGCEFSRAASSFSGRRALFLPRPRPSLHQSCIPIHPSLLLTHISTTTFNCTQARRSLCLSTKTTEKATLVRTFVLQASRQVPPRTKNKMSSRRSLLAALVCAACFLLLALAAPAHGEFFSFFP